MSIGSTTTISYNITDESITININFPSQTAMRFGYPLLYTLESSVGRLTLKQCRVQLDHQNDPSRILHKTHSIFNMKHIFGHTSNTVSKHGVHIMQKTLMCQRRFMYQATKLIPYLFQILNLYPLYYCRRQRGDLIDTFKFLKQELN